MKAQPLRLIDGQYVKTDPADATQLKILMPSPVVPERIIPVIIKGQRDGTPCWTWNGCTDRPTLRPSIRTRTYRGDEIKDACHSWVTEGRAEFLADSTHSLSGSTVDLLDLI